VSAQERFVECPFAECDWTTREPIGDVEADALKAGWDRLVLHLRVVHHASGEPDRHAWTDGADEVMSTLYGEVDDGMVPPFKWSDGDDA
jgi:hypothetical protein